MLGMRVYPVVVITKYAFINEYLQAKPRNVLRARLSQDISMPLNTGSPRHTLVYEEREAQNWRITNTDSN